MDLLGFKLRKMISLEDANIALLLPVPLRQVKTDSCCGYTPYRFQIVFIDINEKN